MRVRQYGQILLWPLQLAALKPGSGINDHWEALQKPGPDNPWREAVDEFEADPAAFKERHYNEFVTFLPYVQRLLYGEGRARRQNDEGAGASAMRVFRRGDVAKARLYSSLGAAPLTVTIANVELYFFYDIDIVLLKLEASCSELPLAQAQDTLYRFGRAYPAGWDQTGRGLHCMQRVEWLDAQGAVLSSSDTEGRERFLSFVSEHRIPRISAHWEWLLKPLALDEANCDQLVRYRQLEYYRMPMMAYLAVDDPRALSRDDFVRLAFVSAAEADESIPFVEGPPAEFEPRFCYDRFWRAGGLAPNTRYLCCGHAMVVVGDADAPFFVDSETGVLAQFRHQHFLLFLLAHFQKAALLMFSDRLVDALNHLDIANPGSVKRFKRSIRHLFEMFLRFTHRYWFHEISEQALTKSLFRMCAAHLNLDSLYRDVRERIHDMSGYLDADSLRRQANTVVRLTVVTTFGLIGTVVTGFLGMNLIDETQAPMGVRVSLFLVVMVATIVLTFYTITKSKRLSDFLDALSDENVPTHLKAGAFFSVWKPRRRGG